MDDIAPTGMCLVRGYIMIDTLTKYDFDVPVNSLEKNIIRLTN